MAIGCNRSVPGQSAAWQIGCADVHWTANDVFESAQAEASLKPDTHQSLNSRRFVVWLVVYLSRWKNMSSSVGMINQLFPINIRKKYIQSILIHHLTNSSKNQQPVAVLTSEFYPVRGLWIHQILLVYRTAFPPGGRAGRGRPRVALALGHLAQGHLAGLWPVVPCYSSEKGKKERQSQVIS